MTASTPTHDQFAIEVRAFLDAHAKRKPSDGARRWGVGEDRFELFEERSLEDERAEVERNRAWRRQLFEAGYGWIAGPPRYGGRGLPESYEHLYHGIEAEYATPSGFPFGIGLNMVAPTILHHGTEAVKERYLRALRRGDLIACQLFSEPNAGSDLAGVQATAVRDGDRWVLDGQKVWTSGAQHADIGEILCRTAAAGASHRSLTAFVVDMRSVGIEVRPLRQMTGGSSFNEVFLNGVSVPDDHRLGAEGTGWSVAITTLMNERSTVGARRSGPSAVAPLDLLVALVRHVGLDRDSLVRHQLADVGVHLRVAELMNERLMRRSDGQSTPGPVMSLAKLAMTGNLQRTAALLGRALGPRLVADAGGWGTYAWAEFVLGVPGFRIAGGTDEVMRNIVAERVLGLPKDRRE